ncbi:MAG: Kinesin [Sclerophora amabilis]|nr:MAG: Kinesin [Sclerophora amabilis]
MAYDPRLCPGVAPELRLLKSSASTPSLRSRESMVVSTSRPETPNGGGNVRVVVRVRAFLPREISRGAQCLIEMDPETQATTLLVPSNTDPTNGRQNTRKVIEEKKFTFDNSFWSHDKADAHYAHQEEVYNILGEEFLDHNFEGYHTCIFAYGQTGSGKSYTMMGTHDQPGLIPRTCEDLFQRIESSTSPNISYSVRVSYFEVYNEHVRDLLVPRQDPPFYLKIRESPTEGPYVKDLTDVPVKNFSEIMRYMKMGDSSRTTASTKMNDTSSRSHAVFTIMLKQIHHDMETDETTERLARIRLVDLAGSERAKATEATGQRLREGSNINKSLTTLGRVIAALADPRHHHSPTKKSKEIVPYRDSILTWLLKDSLGGNSKTAMIACIAPSDYDETLSTLRYADQAKRIRMRATINQDHVSAAERDAQIAAMQETIRVLQLSLNATQQSSSQQAASASTSAIVAARRNAEAQDARLEEYQKQVDTMQRLMQENRQVSECKIRSLQTQNEALKRHLKLAVESLRNPIPTITPDETMDFEEQQLVPDGGKENWDPDAATVTDHIDNMYPAKPTKKDITDDDDKRDTEDGNLGGEEVFDDEGTNHNSSEAADTHLKMQELLQDLGLFRRKVADDHGRFGIRKHPPLGEVSVN